MADRAPARRPDRPTAIERPPAPPQPAPGVGNRAVTRAAGSLGERRPGRGLDGRAALSRLAARPAQRRLARLVHEVDTTQGKFEIDPYEVHEDAAGDVDKVCGLKIEAKYSSPKSLRSNKIGFVQVMKVTKGGKPYLFENEKPRATGFWSFDPGWTVDRVEGKKQGFYGMKDDLTASGTNYWAGSRTSDAAETKARMYDRVNLPRAKGEEMVCTASAFAVDIEHGEYLGGFSWGWKCDKAGNMTATPVAVAEMGWIQRRAIRNWNTQAELSDKTKRNAPDQAKLPEPKLPWYQKILPWNW